MLAFAYCLAARSAASAPAIRQYSLIPYSSIGPDIMTRTSLTQLEARDAFIARHIGPDAAEQQEMLSLLGYASRAP
jgi:uncharacterized membrane protein